MQRFLARRVALAIVTLFAVSLIIFIMSRTAGDPRHLMLDDYSTDEDWERMGEVLGLDKPYYQQYFIFMGNAFRGDFGKSIKEGRPVTSVILERLPATLYLGLTAFVISLLVGIPFGILSSIKRGSLIDQVGKVIAMFGQSAPPFWLGIMLIIFFAVSLEWLPPYGREDWNSIVLPAVTLGWYYAAANLRLVRSAMLDVLDSEYIKLARAKGVPYWGVVLRHAFRNALIPPLTFAGVTLGALDRLPGGGNGVRLARPGQAGDRRAVRLRLSPAPGRGHRLHPALRHGRPLGGRALRLHRPTHPVRIGRFRKRASWWLKRQGLLHHRKASGCA